MFYLIINLLNWYIRDSQISCKETERTVDRKYFYCFSFSTFNFYKIKRKHKFVYHGLPWNVFTLLWDTFEKTSIGEIIFKMKTFLSNLLMCSSRSIIHLLEKYLQSVILFQFYLFSFSMLTRNRIKLNKQDLLHHILDIYAQSLQKIQLAQTNEIHTNLRSIKFLITSFLELSSKSPIILLMCLHLFTNRNFKNLSTMEQFLFLTKILIFKFYLTTQTKK